MGMQVDTGGGGKKRVKPNINVTPLVDVVLVLLIIFMLVIPNMQEGVPIELFKAKNAEKDEEESKPITVSITLPSRPGSRAVAKNDEVGYYLDDAQVSRDELIASLAALHQQDPSRVLLFRGDSRIDYGKIRDVFHECQNLGFAYIQLAVGAQKTGWQED
jgi:biopolymer transport protein TolR